MLQLDSKEAIYKVFNLLKTAAILPSTSIRLHLWKMNTIFKSDENHDGFTIGDNTWQTSYSSSHLEKQIE